MASARQDIRLGDTGTGSLLQTGDRGRAVTFELRLRDCLHASSSQRDERTGALIWAPNQPAVTVSFSAPADNDAPQLAKAQGFPGSGCACWISADAMCV